jgi:superfamily II DNA or RNA helicase
MANQPSNPITRLTQQGYEIQRDTIEPTQLARLTAELTVCPQMRDPTADEIKQQQFKLYRYSADRQQLIVPRYYGVSRFGQPQTTHYAPSPAVFGFTQQLREKQKHVTEKCIRYMQKHGGGVLAVPCGFGKTVCALYIAHRLGLKLLIVVHKTFLMNQWIERAVEFLGIDRQRIGVIKQNRCDVVGKDMVVGMIHTLAKREYDDIFGQFGLVIYDEAHHVACKFFSRTLCKTSAQHTLALTATPYRGDGLIKVMYWFAGGTIYREQIKVNTNVVAKIIYHRSTDTKRFAIKKRWFKGKMCADTGRMQTNLTAIRTRNHMIVQMITSIRRAEPERKILILSGRKDQLDVLKAETDGLIAQDIANGLICEDEITSCYYTGNTSASDRQIAEDQGDIIFATYGMAKEGLDIKHLNTVILASPEKDVVQSIGRVMRTILQAGSVRPLIIDIADDVDGIKHWVGSRAMIYNRCKYAVEDYYLCDTEFMTSHRFEGTVPSIYSTDPWTNRTINRIYGYANQFNDRVRECIRLCGQIDRIVGTTSTFPWFANASELETRDEIEYTRLSDILWVDRLTGKDFETVVTRDADTQPAIGLDQDIEMGYKESNDCSFLQSIAEPDEPVKRMF